MQKITPCLWFDKNGEEAMRFYTSVFKGSNSTDSKIGEITHYGKAESQVSGQPEGLVLTGIFELHGQQFMVLNGGPHFKFNEAISLSVSCKTQEEVDELWEKLSAGGQKGDCGWLKDKFGLSWQIVPEVLPRMIADPDPARRQSVMRAMIKMHKLDIQKLQEAYDHP